MVHLTSRLKSTRGSWWAKRQPDITDLELDCCKDLSFPGSKDCRKWCFSSSSSSSPPSLQLPRPHLIHHSLAPSLPLFHSHCMLPPLFRPISATPLRPRDTTTKKHHKIEESLLAMMRYLSACSVPSTSSSPLLLASKRVTHCWPVNFGDVNESLMGWWTV